MAVVVVQRDKDTNFMRMLRTYLSYVNTSGVINESKKRMYFVSPSIKKKLKRLEAARKVSSNNRTNKRKINTKKKTITSKQPAAFSPVVTPLVN